MKKTLLATLILLSIQSYAQIYPGNPTYHFPYSIQCNGNTKESCVIPVELLLNENESNLSDIQPGNYLRMMVSNIKPSILGGASIYSSAVFKRLPFGSTETEIVLTTRMTSTPSFVPTTLWQYYDKHDISATCYGVVGGSIWTCPVIIPIDTNFNADCCQALLVMLQIIDALLLFLVLVQIIPLALGMMKIFWLTWSQHLIN